MKHIMSNAYVQKHIYQVIIYFYVCRAKIVRYLVFINIQDLLPRLAANTKSICAPATLASELIRTFRTMNGRTGFSPFKNKTVQKNTPVFKI